MVVARSAAARLDAAATVRPLAALSCAALAAARAASREPMMTSRPARTQRRASAAPRLPVPPTIAISASFTARAPELELQSAIAHHRHVGPALIRGAIPAAGCECAAIQVQRRAGHPGRQLARQEQRAACRIIRHTEAPERNPAAHMITILRLDV